MVIIIIYPLKIGWIGRRSRNPAGCLFIFLPTQKVQKKPPDDKVQKKATGNFTMGNWCACCDSCRDGERQDFAGKNFVSIPSAPKSGCDYAEIDFHNFNGATAEKLLRAALTKFSKRGYAPGIASLHLIVGAGTHSGGADKRVIYPMVYEVGRRDFPSFSFSDHPTNHGIIVAQRPLQRR
jgi:hypothetical protein